jgi:LysM repeat protein
MQPKRAVRWLFFLVLLVGSLLPAARIQAAQISSKFRQSGEVTAFDLIIAMNTLRISYGLPALVEDPIINAVAQNTAETMAASQMSWHIGNVSGRIASAGYGGGSKVWATENFAVGYLSIDEIMLVWADESHMIPAVNPAYCHIGAGVAKSSNGRTYYVLQAAYTSGKSCGEYKPSAGNTNPPVGTTNEGAVNPGVPQIIIPVKIATPDNDGKVFHVVEAGQSFWSIAIAYKITIADLETWNNISRNSKLQIGQRLFIPGSNTEGYATPTPVGMIQVSTPDSNGKIIHTVQAYQTLSTIAQAYKISVDTILAFNGLQLDWPLQIGQILLIDPGYVTPSPTPLPLTEIQKLTPESDGKYYHTIQSGETLSWIADFYDLSVTDLMAWNGLNSASIIMPEQKLVLLVTPPVTETPTPRPVTPTATQTMAPHSPTPSLMPTVISTTPGEIENNSLDQAESAVIWFLSLSLAAGGIYLAVLFTRKKH